MQNITKLNPCITCKADRQYGNPDVCQTPCYDCKRRMRWRIDALNRLLEIENILGEDYDLDLLRDFVSKDVAHVVHAKWIGIEGDGYDDDGNIVYDVFECSNCGCEHRADGEPEWTYCQDCGAKMDLED